MVNPLNIINKVINKARGLSPTSQPPRTNPKPQFKKPQYKPIQKAPNEPISKIESVTSTPLVKRNVMTDPTDELIRKVKDPVLKKDLIDRLDFTPNQFGPKNSGNTKARDFDSFINRPDTPEVKDITKGPPSGKHLDYWALDPKFNKNTSGFYGTGAMFTGDKYIAKKVLAAKEAIKWKKKYPSIWKKIKKANPNLTDEEIVIKANRFMDDTPEVKDVAKGLPGGVIDYWALGQKIPKRAKMTTAERKKFQNELKKNNKKKEPSWWEKFNAVNSDKDGNPTGYTYGFTGKNKKVKTISFPKKIVGKRRQKLNEIGSNLAKFSDDPFFFWQPKDR
jgi:hypothetical protein